MKKFNWEDWSGVISFIGFIAIIILLSFWNNISSALSGRGWDPHIATSCKDVTTYDQNWQNDMLCTRSDGSTFYTDYEGARTAIEKGRKSEAAPSTPTTDNEQTVDALPVSNTPSEPSDSQSSTTCIDVTSYDYDWSNDMLCTRPDGSTFYTDYAGARAAESQ